MAAKSEKKGTAVCLFSGGLDSRLAAKLVLNQNVKLHAVHFSSAFVSDEASRNVTGIEETAAGLGMELEQIDVTGELIRLVKNPPHGHGSQLNPCIDCRIMQLKKAHAIMERTDADFIVTGEVVGQRPMTQRKDMLRHIDREAGTAGLVLRPLSALLLEPTRPEEDGLIDRSALCGFSGRTRTPQMKLAEDMDIRNYPPPAGGCRLTEPGYAKRLNDLLMHNQLCPNDLELLLTGRHFRLDENTKLIVGRKHEENERIEELALTEDALLQCANNPGPTAMLRGDRNEPNLNTAARITARYGKTRDMEEVVMAVKTRDRDDKLLKIAPAGKNEFDSLLI